MHKIQPRPTEFADNQHEENQEGEIDAEELELILSITIQNGSFKNDHTWIEAAQRVSIITISKLSL